MNVTIGHAQPLDRSRLRNLALVSTAALLVSVIVVTASLDAQAEDLAKINEMIDRTNAAERNYLEAKQDHVNNPNDVTRARVVATKQTHTQRSNELDSARLATLAEYSGLVEQDIEQLRTGADTWEATAREIGVHPSVIGIEIIDARPPPFVGSEP